MQTFFDQKRYLSGRDALHDNHFKVKEQNLAQYDSFLVSKEIAYALMDEGKSPAIYQLSTHSAWVSGGILPPDKKIFPPMICVCDHEFYDPLVGPNPVSKSTILGSYRSSQKIIPTEYLNHRSLEYKLVGNPAGNTMNIPNLGFLPRSLLSLDDLIANIRRSPLDSLRILHWGAHAPDHDNPLTLHESPSLDGVTFLKIDLPRVPIYDHKFIRTMLCIPIEEDDAIRLAPSSKNISEELKHNTDLLIGIYFTTFEHDFPIGIKKWHHEYNSISWLSLHLLLKHIWKTDEEALQYFSEHTVQLENFSRNRKALDALKEARESMNNNEPEIISDEPE